jgi:hypothetical protein
MPKRRSRVRAAEGHLREDERELALNDLEELEQSVSKA